MNICFPKDWALYFLQKFMKVLHELRELSIPYL